MFERAKNPKKFGKDELKFVKFFYSPAICGHCQCYFPSQNVLKLHEDLKKCGDPDKEVTEPPI